MLVFLIPILLVLMAIIWAFIVNAQMIYYWLTEHTNVLAILIGLLCATVISLILLLFIVKKYTHKFRLKICARFILVLNIILLLSVVIYANLNVFIEQISVVDLSIRGELSYLLVGNLGLFALIFFLLRYYYGQFTFVIYSSKNYILYLRSFLFDGRDIEVENELRRVKENHYVDILTIGNPKTILCKTVGHTFYLPSTNWKKWVEYYIIDAEKIVLVVDGTDGVLWEMLEHVDYINKFVFVVPQKQALLNLIVFSTKNENGANVIWRKWLEELAVNANQDRFIFTIRNGKCNIDTISEIDKYLFDKVEGEKEHIKDSKYLSHADYHKLERRSIIKRNIEKLIAEIGDFLQDVVEFVLDFFEAVINSKIFRLLVCMALTIVSLVSCIVSFVERDLATGIALVVCALGFGGAAFCIIKY